MGAANCAKYIRKRNTYNDFDIKLFNFNFKEIYKIFGFIKDTELNEVIKIKIFKRDTYIIKYINSCENTFSILRYKLYRLYKLKNKKIVHHYCFSD